MTQFLSWHYDNYNCPLRHNRTSLEWNVINFRYWFSNYLLIFYTTVWDYICIVPGGILSSQDSTGLFVSEGSPIGSRAPDRAFSVLAYTTGAFYSWLTVSKEDQHKPGCTHTACFVMLSLISHIYILSIYSLIWILYGSAENLPVEI